MSQQSFNQLRRDAALQEIDSWDYFRSVRWLDETHSTNRQLGDEIRADQIQSPAILIATKQTSGKGRGGNQWFSPPGCLMFTMAIPFRAPDSPLLPLEIGVCLARAIAPISRSSPKVKWPNDVYIEGKKVCGILIEVLQKSPSGDSVALVGVGMNCEVNFANSDTKVQEFATSLHLVANPSMRQETSVEDVLIRVLQMWMQLEELRSEAPDWLLRDWSEYSYLDGKWVVVDNGVSADASGRIEGICLGIDRNGALLLESSPGKATPVIAGTIQSILEA